MIPWYIKYSMTSPLSREQQLFLDLYTEEEFVALIPIELLINKPTKTFLHECVALVENYINTGEWEWQQFEK